MKRQSSPSNGLGGPQWDSELGCPGRVVLPVLSEAGSVYLPLLPLASHTP